MAPNIRSFEAPQLGLSPTETGVQAATQAARRAGAFFNEVANSTEQVGNQIGRQLDSSIKDAGAVAVQYAEHQEISHGAAAYAALNDDLTRKWNDAAKSADPNDPTLAAQFREQVLEPALQDYAKGFTTEGGQRFAEARIDSLRNHMFEKTAADMSLLAKDAVSVNVHQTANSLSNTAMSDPSSVPHLLATADGLVGGMVESAPNLRGADSARARLELTEKMKEAIVKSGAVGAIQQAADPEAEATKWGETYPKYISGEELKQLSGAARAQIRARHIDESYVRVQQDRAQKDLSDRTQTGYMQKLFSDDPNDRADVTAKSIVNNPDLTLAGKKETLALVNRETKPETDARISAASSVALFRQIRDPKSDPEAVRAAIMDARGKDPGTQGSITKSDFSDLMKNLEDIKTPAGAALAQDRNEFFKRYAGSIDGYLAQRGLHSALGGQKMYMAEKDARRLEAELKKNGQDPHSLYDPTSPNFFGRPANLSKYQVSMQDAERYSMAGGANAPAGSPAAQQPAPARPATPAVGEMRQGFKFKGGDPSKPESWEKAQ